MSTFSALPQALQQRLRNELKPGESVIWAGQPIPGLYMKPGFKSWIFFIPWTAFALFWIVAACGFQVPKFEPGWGIFPLFGLPFLLVGLFGLCSPIFLRRKASTTIYALTNQRALTIEGRKSLTVRSYKAADIVETERTEYIDGSGDLILLKQSKRDSDGDEKISSYGFFSIQEVKRVERLLDVLRQENTA